MSSWNEKPFFDAGSISEFEYRDLEREDEKEYLDWLKEDENLCGFDDWGIIKRRIEFIQDHPL